MHLKQLREDDDVEAEADIAFERVTIATLGEFRRRVGRIGVMVAFSSGSASGCREAGLPLCADTFRDRLGRRDVPTTPSLCAASVMNI